MRLSNRYYRCFFTGHRIIANSEEVKYRLKEVIEALINENGVDEFICGGAIGFDTLAARAVLELKEKYDWIKLKIYIPCYEHYIKWNMRDREIWKKISSKADEIKYITQGPYDSQCMHRRNRAMVNDAHFCVAYCLNGASGTGVTLRFAREMSCDIRNIAE